MTADQIEGLEKKYLKEITTLRNLTAASVEAENVKLREALNYIGAITPDGGGVNMVVDKALSTPPSTSALDEIVKERTMELESLLEQAQNGLYWYQEMHPEDASPADDELHADIDRVLSKEGEQ